MFQRVVLTGLLVSFIGLFLGCVSTESTSVSTQDFMLSMQDDALFISDLVPGDRIEVSVEVDGIMEVSSHRAELNHQGMVTLPLIGDVRIEGLKLDEARNIISKTYGAYYVNPPVVMLAMVNDGDSSEWGSVTVLGRVNQPGLVPVASRRGIPLSAAVQAAGGFSSSAKISDIRISRIDGKGNKIQVSVDFKQIGLAGNSEADLPLKAGDIIYIPERIF